MAVLGAAEILARSALATEPVELPGGGTVLVRELSVAQRGEFAEVVRGKGATGLLAWLVAEAAVDEAGKRLFSGDDAAKLADASPRLLEVIGQAVLRVSGMSQKEGDESGEG